MDTGSLSRLFPSEPPHIVSDSILACKLFSNLGFKSIFLGDLIRGTEPTPNSVILITCDPKLIPARGLLSKLFGQSSVLIVPLLSFAADDEAIIYFSETLPRVDFQAACQANLSLVEALEQTQVPIMVSSGEFSMAVDLSLSLEIALPKLNPEIAKGEWVSLGQFLEIGLVPNEGHTAFNVNGTLICDGVAVAHHRHNLESARPKAFEAWNILSQVRKDGGFPLNVEVCSSKVISVKTTAGKDLLPDLLPLTDEVFRGMLTEVAFASTSAFTEVDWTINSQLNEGAGGSHIALGTGVHAAHIDFVSSNAKFIIDKSA